MADSRSSDRDKSSRSPLVKSKSLHSQKIIQLSPSDKRPQDIPEDAEAPREHTPQRSHTPGHLSSKSQDKRRKASELALRQRSQSLSQKESSSSSHKSSSKSSHHGSSTPKPETPKSPPMSSTPAPPPPLSTTSSASPSLATPTAPRPLNARSTSAIAPKQATETPTTPSRNIKPQVQIPSNRPIIKRPPFPDPATEPDVEPAPASGMYWSQAPLSGTPPAALRAHTTTLVGSSIYVFGGCSALSCFNELYVLDADSFYFSTPFVCGEIPLPLRAMTCTAVGKKLVIFGGGDGPAYYNDVYVLDTMNFRWSKPTVSGDGRNGDRYPSKRRAHTACLWRNGIYVFGGGDGVQALNDVWRLDVADTNKMSWKLISPPTPEDRSKPKSRGYHTANMVGSKLIIYGGSDGGECFGDVWIFDAATALFTPVSIPKAASYPRLSHTATIVGSYLFVLGGHDGVEYCNEVLLLNLVTMVWDKRHVYGAKMKSRGYHGAVLHDSRLYVVGGFDGGQAFGDVWLLELAVHAYYSQISHFSIDV